MPLKDALPLLDWLQSYAKEKYPDYHYLFEDFYKNFSNYIENPNKNSANLICMGQMPFLTNFENSEDPFINQTISVVLDLTQAIHDAEDQEAWLKMALERFVILKSLDHGSSG